MRNKIGITILTISTLLLLTSYLSNSKDENYERNAENEQMNEYEK